MHNDQWSVDRRTVLRATGVAGVTAGLAGCLGALQGDESADNVVLSPPEDFDQDVADETGHPTYGDQVPDLSAPAPLRDETVSTTDFVGERHSVYTFLFTRCPSACPGLMANLRHVQDDAVADGYTDEVALLPVTFDPEYDTADVLEEYEDAHGVDRDADNWYSLRPETPAAAREFVEEGFGVAFAENEDVGHDDHDENGDDEDDEHEGDDDDDGNDNGHDDNGHADGDDDNGHDHNEDVMAFAHTNLVLVVNKDGYVERAYQGEVPTPANVVDDVSTVIERW